MQLKSSCPQYRTGKRYLRWTGIEDNHNERVAVEQAIILSVFTQFRIIVEAVIYIHPHGIQLS
jgi:hypothetical protein